VKCAGWAIKAGAQKVKWTDLAMPHEGALGGKHKRLALRSLLLLQWQLQ
jgi:hypothetical protein